MTCDGFLVLPDVDAAAPARVAVPLMSAQVFSHPSGRPWLVGRWTQDQIVVAAAGPVRVGVIGTCPITPTRLSELAARVRTVSDVDALVAALPGSCHVVASVHGRVRAQGSVTGLYRMFHARVRGVHIAADRADLIAAMLDAGLNEQVLAARVAYGLSLPAPLNEQPLWSGISALAPDQCLVWHHDQAREVRWWRPPAAERSLAQGAAAVRDALDTALCHRAPAQGRLSADLSGGMDSTSLCFLAARDVPDLMTTRWGEAEAGNDDAVFATHAITALGQAEHLVISPAELPENFAEPDVVASAEEPYLGTRTAARHRFTARLLAQRGSRRHLAGYGGDELFSPLPGYLHGLLRRSPITALRDVRGYAALHRWPLLRTLAELLRPNDVTAWWRAQEDHLANPAPPARRPVLGRGLWPLRVPPWLTSAGTELVREALRHTADHAQPLADNLDQHQSLLALRTTSSLYRLLIRLYAEDGVELDLPYLDQHVVEAVLAVRTHEHAGPWRYKPLLTEAMRGIVPGTILARTTKGESGEDVRVGLRRHLPAIVEMFADSTLAQRGLVNADALRARLVAPQQDNTTIFALESLLGCETWLRAATQPRRTDAATTAP